MTTEKTLLEMEQKFWTAGEDAYRANLDTECLCAFTEMAGVMSKEQIVASVADSPRWTGVEIKEHGFLEFDGSFAVLTYEASAARPDGDRYRALVSSGYVNRDGDWKMAFHQQTPLAAS